MSYGIIYFNTFVNVVFWFIWPHLNANKGSVQHLLCAILVSIDGLAFPQSTVFDMFFQLILWLFWCHHVRLSKTVFSWSLPISLPVYHSCCQVFKAFPSCHVPDKWLLFYFAFNFPFSFAFTHCVSSYLPMLILTMF